MYLDLYIKKKIALSSLRSYKDSQLDYFKKANFNSWNFLTHCEKGTFLSWMKIAKYLFLKNLEDVFCFGNPFSLCLAICIYFYREFQMQIPRDSRYLACYIWANNIYVKFYLNPLKCSLSILFIQKRINRSYEHSV